MTNKEMKRMKRMSVDKRLKCEATSFGPPNNI